MWFLARSHFLEWLHSEEKHWSGLVKNHLCHSKTGNRGQGGWSEGGLYMAPARAMNSSSRQCGSMLGTLSSGNTSHPPPHPCVAGAEVVTSCAQAPTRVPWDHLGLTQGIGLNIPKQPFHLLPNSNLKPCHAFADCVEGVRNLKKVECRFGLFDMY